MIEKEKGNQEQGVELSKTKLTILSVISWVFAITVVFLAIATGITFYYYIYSAIHDKDYHLITEKLNSWLYFGCKILDLTVIFVFAFSIIKIWKYLRN